MPQSLLTTARHLTRVTLLAAAALVTALCLPSPHGAADTGRPALRQPRAVLDRSHAQEPPGNAEREPAGHAPSAEDPWPGDRPPTGGSQGRGTRPVPCPPAPRGDRETGPPQG
ncbi:hypothetical protein ALMP_54960 [Streptomyces sp. A012304]|nr:hypothetical protein ALMP_54960 [Streptomyces sp. A012304]